MALICWQQKVSRKQVENKERHFVEVAKGKDQCLSQNENHGLKTFYASLHLTLSLPECLMKFCKVALTFESVDETLWSDHSNETSLPVLTHGATCFSRFHKINLGFFVEFYLWPHLAVKGLK